MATAAVVGASGYSGQETLDRVLGHPQLELVALGSDSLMGQPATALDPRLGRNGGCAPAFIANDEALGSDADVVFVCLSHEEAAALTPPERGVVVDLSGAHRLRDASLYELWYGFAHPNVRQQGEWCYAVTEVSPPTGRLIANPGCYATAAILALAPLAEVVEPSNVIVVDAKSGVSGAGRTLKASSHAGFVLENFSAYKVGRHQHEPEIAQALGFPVCFVPHLLPIRRGLQTTCYVQGIGAEEARARIEGAYAGSRVVTVLPDGAVPELARLHGTDVAEIAVFGDLATGTTIVICAIDNLGKGAAGQAVQNANISLGLEETAGLRLTGVLV